MISDALEWFEDLFVQLMTFIVKLEITEL